MAKKQKKEKPDNRAHVIGVAFYDEYEAVKKAAEAQRMKYSPFCREVLRKFLGLPSMLDRAAPAMHPGERAFREINGELTGGIPPPREVID